MRQGHVQLESRDSGLAPGQWAAFYRGQECLGGGVISENNFLPSHATEERRGAGWGRGGGEKQGNQNSEVSFLQDS